MRRSSSPPPTRLRGHHLLCLYGFRGLGYRDAFVKNLAALLGAVRERPEQLLEALDKPDDICGACPHMQDGRCTKKGKESEHNVAEHDREVLRLLGITPGHALPARQIFALVEQRILPEDLRVLCKGCQWLSLGYCEEGLSERTVLGPPDRGARPRSRTNHQPDRSLTSPAR